MRPSGSTARCTWPIEAAAAASCEMSSNRSSGGSSHSSSSTCRTVSQGIGGASERSFDSFSWYSSRYSGGRNSVSMNEASCPIFIAAPFIVPSASTIRSAVSMCDLSSAAAPFSFDRTRFAARVPAYLAPDVPMTCVTLAVRCARP